MKADKMRTSHMVAIAVIEMMVLSSFGLPVGSNDGEMVSYDNDGNEDTRALAASPWPMFGGNAQHTFESTYDASENPGKTKWKYFLQGSDLHTPVIGTDGTIYFTSEDVKEYDLGFLYAINPDGTFKWWYRVKEDGDSYLASHLAIGVDDVIYFSRGDAYLFALNPNGTLKWKFETEDKVYSSPSIGPDGTIYMGSDDKYLYAINPDGTMKWKYQTGDKVKSSAAIGYDGTIYINSEDGYLYSIGPDGTLNWKVHDILYMPSIAKDGTIYSSNHYGLVSLYPDGTLKWTYENISSQFAIDSDGTLYFCYRDNGSAINRSYLYAMNPNSTIKWKLELMEGTTSAANWHSPISLSSDGTIFCGISNRIEPWTGTIFAVNPNGTLKWSSEHQNTLITGPIIGPDGTLYMCFYNYILAMGEEGNLPSSPPLPPLNLDVTPGDGYLNLFWDIPEDDGGSSLERYKIYRGSSSNRETLFATISSSNTNFNDTSIVNGATYYYYVTSVNAYSESQPSNEIVVASNPYPKPPTLADSPWPTFGGNNWHTGASQYDTSQNPGKLSWKVRIGDSGRASPAIGEDGAIYTGTKTDFLNAILPNGTIKWKFEVGSDIESTPAIGSDGTIYVGSNDNNLYAINPNGTLKWTFETAGFRNLGSPIIGFDGTIYLTAAALYAINPDGTLKWKTDDSHTNTALVIGKDGTIYTSSGNSLQAFNPDGKLRWDAMITGSILSSVAMDPNGIIYLGTSSLLEDNSVYAFFNNGTIKWRFESINQTKTPPSIGPDGTIYIGSLDEHLYAINPDGTLKWKAEYALGYGGIAIGAESTLYFGSVDNYIYAVNSDGTLKWRVETRSSIISSPAIGSDGTIYMGSNDDYFYAINKGSPSPPPNLTVSAGDGFVELKWEPPTDDGGLSITGYKIYRGKDINDMELLKTVNGSKTSYRDKSVKNGEEYFYHVTAENENGESDKSDDISKIPLADSGKYILAMIVMMILLIIGAIIFLRIREKRKKKKAPQEGAPSSTEPMKAGSPHPIPTYSVLIVASKENNLLRPKKNKNPKHPAPRSPQHLKFRAPQTPSAAPGAISFSQHLQMPHRSNAPIVDSRGRRRYNTPSQAEN